MPIFGSDGAFVGIVDRVSGVRIVVQRTGVSDADQHFIPLARVASVTDRVTLDCPAADARAPSATRTESGRQGTIGPIVWGGVGVAALALLYGAMHMISRASPGDNAKPIPAPAPTGVASAASIAAARGPAPSARAASGPVLAQPVTIAEFLNSNDPVPRFFSLDNIDFTAGSAALGAAATKVVVGIAEVMTTHLNTQIKLAVSSQAGALGLRRATAIRTALVARGVAAYRITIGTQRGRTRAGKAGIDMVVLAK